MLKRVQIDSIVALFKRGVTSETIHKLMLLAQRVQRLTRDTKGKMTERQGRAFERAVQDANTLATGVHAKGASTQPIDGHHTLVIIWHSGEPTVLH